MLYIVVIVVVVEHSLNDYMIKPFPFRNSTHRISAVFFVIILIIIIITTSVVILAYSYWRTNCELMALGEDNSKSNYNCCHQTNQSCVTCCCLHFVVRRFETKRDETKRTEPNEARRNGASTTYSISALCCRAAATRALWPDNNC